MHCEALLLLAVRGITTVVRYCIAGGCFLIIKYKCASGVSLHTDGRRAPGYSVVANTKEAGRRILVDRPTAYLLA